MSFIKSGSLFLLVLLTASCAKEAENSPEVPMESTETMLSEDPETEQVMATEISPAELSALAKGDKYTLMINDSLSFDLLVGSRNEFVKGITSLSASITGEKKGMATLSIQADTVAGNFQFPGEEWIYVLGYNRETGGHELRKIKPDVISGDDLMYPDSSTN